MRLTILAGIAAFTLQFTNCTPNSSVAGGSSTVENPRIMALVHHPDGSSAVGAAVRLRRSDFVAQTPSLSKGTLIGADALTDSSGRFEISGIDPGSYALETTDDSSATLTRFDVNAGDTRDLGISILQPFATAIGMADTAGRAGGSLYVQVAGLQRLVAVDASGRYTINGLPAGNFEVRVVVARAGGVDLKSRDSVQALSGDTAVVSSSLPAPWLQATIGDDAPRGGAMYGNGEFTVAGGGSDIFWTTDGFHFVYRRFAGDFELRARVRSLETPVSPLQNVPKAGVMIRESLQPDSRHATVSWDSRNNGTILHWRTASGDSSGFKGLAKNGQLPPVWLSIGRIGAMMYGQCSYDEITWTDRDSLPMVLPDTVYLGLSVTSGDVERLNTAVFDSVSVR